VALQGGRPTSTSTVFDPSQRTAALPHLQGLEFGTASAGSLAASLRAIAADATVPAQTLDILQLLFTKPMQVKCLAP